MQACYKINVTRQLGTATIRRATTRLVLVFFKISLFSCSSTIFAPPFCHFYFDPAYLLRDYAVMGDADRLQGPGSEDVDAENKYLPGLRRCRRRDWCALVNSVLGIRLSLRTHSRSGHKSTERKGADLFQIVLNGPNTRPVTRLRKDLIDKFEELR
ncbi:hypothetical protein SUGI_0582750 [Cryptomeria japonica]|nr:hypothetical protein SUGI_0582750 [Cryptomeria japonica]